MFVPMRETVPVVDPSATSGVLSLLWVIIALPALGAVVILLLGNARTSKFAHLLGCATVLGSFVLSVLTFVTLLGRPEDDRQVGQTLYTWVEGGGFKVDFGLLYDPLSALFLLLITGVGSLIHIYSVGYMEHDVRRARFFAYLNLFVAAMLTLVLADNYLVRLPRLGGRRPRVVPADRVLAAQALRRGRAKKAFVVNRVGDIGMALGTMLVFATFGTVGFAGVSAAADRASSTTHAAARAAVPARRLRQVRAGAAAVLAARRHGGPDPGVGADPRGNHGHRRCLPRRPVELHLRLLRDRPDRRRRRRRGDAAVGRGHRVREGRHQEGARRVHDEPDRLHDAGRRARTRRLRVRDLPPDDARLLQGQHVPRRRLGDARHGRRRGHAALRRAGQGHPRHVPDLLDRLPRDHRGPAVRRLLVEGQDHRGGLRRQPRRRDRRHGRRRDHRVLHDPADADDVLRQEALAGGRPPARVAAR